jgi:ribonuclease R
MQKRRERNERKEDAVYHSDLKTYEGTISITSRGVGYVSTESLKEDIEVPTGQTGFALNRDTVLISVFPGRRVGRLQGKILKVIKRDRTRFVGTASLENGKTFIVPDNKRIHVDFLPQENVTPGEKVLFEIASWEKPKDAPLAKIIKVIGKKGVNDVEMEAIVLERGFNATFEPELVSEAEAIREKAKKEFEEEIRKRRDLRDLKTCTIDPEDAKDFDDALSFQKLPNGNFEIGIHIADVSHYIRPKTMLDTEAQKRGVSIYLVDRTIPMLPEALSNDLCSLNPNEDKFAFSAIFEMDTKGVVLKRWLGKSVIRSDKRFSYEEAQSVLESGEGVFREELATLNMLAKQLMAERFREGAISFEQDEVKFELDHEGFPVRV